MALLIPDGLPSKDGPGQPCLALRESNSARLAVMELEGTLVIHLKTFYIVNVVNPSDQSHRIE